MRTALGLFLLYLVVSSLDRYSILAPRYDGNHQYTAAELARLGIALWVMVIWVQAITILLLTPAFVAGAIAEDRQRKVLGYLLASPLSGGEIVLGKLAARLVNLVVLVAVGLPIVSIALFLGGIDPDTVWLGFAVSFATLYLLAGFSILVSTYAERPREAIVRVYLFELIWLFLPVIETMLVHSGGELGRLTREARPITEWVTAGIPTTLFFQNVGLTGLAPDNSVFLWMIGLELLQGTLMLAWATLRLRPLEQGSRLLAWRWLHQSGGPQPFRVFRRRPCGDTPMIWKECSGTLYSPSRWQAICVLVIIAAAAVALVYLVYRLGLPAFHEVLDYGYGATGIQSDRDLLSGAVRALTASLYLLTAMLLAAAAATGMTMERERDTWTSLTVTPLDSREILVAKIAGAFWRVRGLLYGLALVWLIGAFCGAVHPLGLTLALVATAIYLGFIGVLGTYLSLRSKSSARAIAFTIAIMVFLNGGYLFCCGPALNGPENFVLTAGITPMIVTYAPCSYMEMEEFLHIQSYPHYGPSRDTLIITGLVSLACYGGMAVVLFQMCLGRFELEVGRPLRVLPDYLENVSSEGIVFQSPDDDRPTQEGILFEEPGSGEVRDLQPPKDTIPAESTETTH